MKNHPCAPQKWGQRTFLYPTDQRKEASLYARQSPQN